MKKLIKARLEGREVTPVEKPDKPAKVVDLMATLKQSLAQTDKKKGPHRAEEAQAASEVELKPKPQRAQRKKPKKAA